MSQFLEDDQENYYQTTVEYIIWAVEIRQIYINLEISLLSRYLAQPRHGHLDLGFHNFSFLKSHAKSKLVLDPFKNVFDGEFMMHDW